MNNDQQWLKNIIDEHFNSAAHLARQIKVSKQYISGVLQGIEHLSDRVRLLIERKITDKPKCRLSIKHPLTLKNCNDYLKKKFGQILSKANFYNAIKNGRLAVIECHYGKNGKYIVTKDSLERFKFKFKR